MFSLSSVLGKKGTVAVVFASCVSTHVWVRFFLETDKYDKKARNYPDTLPERLKLNQSSWIPSTLTKTSLIAPEEVQIRHFNKLGFSMADIEAARKSLSAPHIQNEDTLISKLLENKKDKTLRSPFCSFTVDTFSSVVTKEEFNDSFTIYTVMKGEAKETMLFDDAAFPFNVSAYATAAMSTIIGIKMFDRISSFWIKHIPTGISGAIQCRRATLLCFGIAFPFLFIQKYLADKQLGEKKKLSSAVFGGLAAKSGQEQHTITIRTCANESYYDPKGTFADFAGLGLLGIIFCAPVGYFVGGLAAILL